MLLLIAGIALALLATETVAALVTPIPARAVIFTTLLLQAWTLETRKLWHALRHPLPALWALVISYGLVPLLALAVGQLLPVDDDYQIGLMIIAAVPCTLASAAIWTRLAGGNEAVALLVTLLTTCTSWLITTAWLAGLTQTSVQLDPIKMMGDLLVFLFLPVCLGQLVRLSPHGRRWAERGKTTVAVVNRLLIFIIIVQAVLLAADCLRATEVRGELPSLGLVLAACLGIHLLAWAVGYGGGRLARIDLPTCIAVGFACSQKTLPIGVLLVDEYFKQDYPLAVVPVLFFHVGQLVVDTFLADAVRRTDLQSVPPGVS